MARSKDYISPNLRQRVFERDNYICRYCGSTEGPFHADHVYPESRGGRTVLGNLVTACAVCNGKKHAKIGVWPLPTDHFVARSSRVKHQAVSFVLATLFTIAFVYFKSVGIQPQTAIAALLSAMAVCYLVGISMIRHQ